MWTKIADGYEWGVAGMARRGGAASRARESAVVISPARKTGADGVTT